MRHWNHSLEFGIEKLEEIFHSPKHIFEISLNSSIPLSFFLFSADELILFWCWGTFFGREENDVEMLKGENKIGSLFSTFAHTNELKISPNMNKTFFSFKYSKKVIKSYHYESHTKKEWTWKQRWWMFS